MQESNMATESARSRLQEQEVYNQESLGRIQSLEGELAELQQSYQVCVYVLTMWNSMFVQLKCCSLNKCILLVRL